MNETRCDDSKHKIPFDEWTTTARDEKCYSRVWATQTKFSAEKLNLSHITAHRDIITFARLFNADLDSFAKAIWNGSGGRRCNEQGGWRNKHRNTNWKRKRRKFFKSNGKYRKNAEQTAAVGVFLWRNLRFSIFKKNPKCNSKWKRQMLLWWYRNCLHLPNIKTDAFAWQKTTCEMERIDVDMSVIRIWFFFSFIRLLRNFLVYLFSVASSNSIVKMLIHC